jgi:hypothetical protein
MRMRCRADLVRTLRVHCGNALMLQHTVLVCAGTQQYPTWPVYKWTTVIVSGSRHVEAPSTEALLPPMQVPCPQNAAAAPAAVVAAACVLKAPRTC